MKNILLTLNICAALLLVSCHQNPTDKVSTTPIPDAHTVDRKVSQLAVNKDLVCGMPIEEGNIADTTTHESKIYGFCSAECKAEFLKNPQTYLAQQ